jgi:putative endonuclease
VYYVYVLKSELDGSYYIGQTKDIESRIISHNKGKNRSTKAYRPYLLAYKKKFYTRSEAVKYEIELKNIKKRILFENKLKLENTAPW